MMRRMHKVATVAMAPATKALASTRILNHVVEQGSVGLKFRRAGTGMNPVVDPSAIWRCFDPVLICDAPQFAHPTEPSEIRLDSCDPKAILRDRHKQLTATAAQFESLRSNGRLPTFLPRKAAKKEELGFVNIDGQLDTRVEIKSSRRLGDRELVKRSGAESDDRMNLIDGSR